MAKRSGCDLGMKARWSDYVYQERIDDRIKFFTYAVRR